ncbi:C-terminal [Bartonella apihabitans]|uniref:IclR family transcriptional regulator n=1 Tax=Bartonella apihabitans TaxID=2750929 RepID=UPI003998F157
MSDHTVIVNDDAETPELINKSVIKATVILEELGRHAEGVTPTELAQYVKMSRPTVFRLLLSLEQNGFVERSDNKYKLGWKIARLGRLANPYKGMIAIIQPILKTLAESLNEMVGYAVAKGGADFDLISEAHGSRLITLIRGYVGRDFPIYASATGKFVLSEMRDEDVVALLPKKFSKVASKTITDRQKLIEELHLIRSQGYAVVDDELEESLFAMGVGVYDKTGQFIGVLSVTGPGPRMKQRDINDILTPLHQTAKLIAEALA